MDTRFPTEDFLSSIHTSPATDPACSGYLLDGLWLVASEPTPTKPVGQEHNTTSNTAHAYRDTSSPLFTTVPLASDPHDPHQAQAPPHPQDAQSATSLVTCDDATSRDHPSPSPPPSQPSSEDPAALHRVDTLGSAVSGEDSPAWMDLCDIEFARVAAWAGGGGAAEQAVQLDAHLRSPEEVRRDRAAALERFRYKKRNKSAKRLVRYWCRKELADSRPRVKGRFVKKTEIGLWKKYGDAFREHLDELKEELLRKR